MTGIPSLLDLPNPPRPWAYFLSAGSNGSAPEDRYVSRTEYPPIDKHSYWGNRTEWARKAVDEGAAGIWDHNPFGLSPEPENPSHIMEFDQHLLAKKAGPEWLTDKYVEAWLWFRDKYPTVPVVHYLGDLQHARLTAITDPDDWLQYAKDAVKPLMDAGVSLGVDGSWKYAAGSRECQFMEMLQSLGTRIVIEPAWSPDAPHMRQFDSVVRRDTFKSPDWAGKFDADVPAGRRRFVIIDDPPRGQRSVVLGDFLAECEAEGSTALVPWHLMKQNMLDTLLGEGRARIQQSSGGRPAP